MVEGGRSQALGHQDLGGKIQCIHPTKGHRILTTKHATPKESESCKKQTKKTRTHELINAFIFGTFRYQCYCPYEGFQFFAYLH